MIRPSRHDIPRSSVVRGQRASGDDLPRFAGSRFNSVEHIAHIVFALIVCAACVWFYQTFLAAVPAISRVIGGK
jgi:hypothetical protein